MEQKEILKEIKNTLEAIKLYDGINIYNILNNEINQTINIYKNSSIDYIYISYDKNYCIRCMTPLEYYYLLINKLNLKNNCIESGLNYEANSIRFSVVWCEHDLIIAFKPVIIDLEYGKKRFYTIQNGAISKGWILWNVKPMKYNNKYYVLAIKKNEVIDYTINIKNVSAYEITKDEYIITLEHHRAENPTELKRHLKSKDLYYKKHALLFKPVIEKLYNIKIDEV